LEIIKFEPCSCCENKFATIELIYGIPGPDYTFGELRKNRRINLENIFYL
jgi:hypothetical protein